MLLPTGKIKQEERAGKKKILRVLHKISQLFFLSTHKNQTVSLQFVTSPRTITAKWVSSASSPSSVFWHKLITRLDGEGSAGAADTHCLSQNGLMSELLSQKFLHRSNPVRWEKAKHQCIMARRVLRDRTSALQLRNLLPQGNCSDDFQLAAELPQVEHFTGVCSRALVQSTLNSLSYDKKREFGWLTWTGSTQLIQEHFFIHVIGNSWQN